MLAVLAVHRPCCPLSLLSVVLTISRFHCPSFLPSIVLTVLAVCRPHCLRCPWSSQSIVRHPRCLSACRLPIVVVLVVCMRPVLIVLAVCCACHLLVLPSVVLTGRCSLSVGGMLIAHPTSVTVVARCPPRLLSVVLANHHACRWACSLPALSAIGYAHSCPVCLLLAVLSGRHSWRCSCMLFGGLAVSLPCWPAARSLVVPLIVTGGEQVEGGGR